MNGQNRKELDWDATASKRALLEPSEAPNWETYKYIFIIIF